MPIYDHVCLTCGSKQNDVLNDTPICCGNPMERQFPTKVAIRFIGEGFYINDSRVDQGDAGKPMTNFSGLEDNMDGNLV